MSIVCWKTPHGVSDSVHYDVSPEFTYLVFNDIESHSRGPDAVRAQHGVGISARKRIFLRDSLPAMDLARVEMRQQGVDVHC
jgi:hypothetical protein